MFLTPKPYENIMPNGNLSIESRFPVAVMKQPNSFLEMKINTKIQGGQSKLFCLNECLINSTSNQMKATAIYPTYGVSFVKSQ